MKPGNFEGDICGRNGCPGVIEERPVENCSCHINPPCPECLTPREYCDTCGWEADEDNTEEQS